MALIETEKAILAMALDRDDLVPILFDNLTSDYFHGYNVDVFRAIADLRESGMDTKWATVRDHAGAKVPVSFWTSLMEATRGLHSSGYEPFMRERVQALKAERGQRLLMAEINQAAGKPALDEDDVEHLGATVEAMRYIGRTRETPSLADAVSAYQEHIRQEASEITTGLHSLDYRIDGFNPGELVTVMARAGVGKTFVALNIMNHLAGKVPYKMAMFSLEMPKAAIIERMLEVYFMRSRQDVKRDALEGTLDKAGFSARFEKLSIYDKIYSVAEIRKIVEKEGYRVVVIDFLHLIRSEIVGDPYRQISAVIAGLKQMAKDTGCVAFLLHQLSRKAGSGWIQVEAVHARDSGQVEELSDFLIGVWAPGLNPEAPIDAQNTLRVGLLKNKRGERWGFTCHFDPRCGKITEMESEGDYGHGRYETARRNRGLYGDRGGEGTGD